ncbi:Peptidase A22A, presenilin [Parasponia andersonii]|uniref:Presenilin n=1 Tax=Parasponia andersonii TaxID=3476 RepID=A0A2P5DB73_PARAD|nr:Peptidase A22A, presenilin [Parasponia andersonii]
MAQNQRPSTILESLGEELIRIITPVSICMFMVVLLVSILSSDTSSSSANFSTMATMAYSESSSDSSWDKFVGALLNSLVFVAVVTVVTFVLVLLFYLRCTKFLKLYMGFSSFLVLMFMGGQIAVFLIQDFGIPIDCVTFLVALFNFAVVGVLAVFMSKMAIFVTQGYLVVIGMLVAYWFTLLPEWTTWVLLVAMALYDLAAVLLPVGPLRILVELAISRDEDLPALVYEARPVTNNDSGVVQRRVWRDRRNDSSNSGADSDFSADSVLDGSENHWISSNLNVDSNSNSNLGERNVPSLVRAEERQVVERNSELAAPLLEQRINIPRIEQENVVSTENMVLEGIGLGSSAGLGVTLVLLAVYQKALPALPVSIMLGVLFYFLTRFVLEVFIVECSLNLLMF